MDISILDVATAANAGRQMEVRNANGQVLRDAAKKPITITLLGQYSDAVQAYDTKVTNRRFDAAAKGMTKITKEELKEEATDRLVVATKAWDFSELDGKTFPCTPENARLLWDDLRFGHLRDQAVQFINSDANFMPA